MPRVEFTIYCQTSGPGVNISDDYETASGAKLKSQVKVREKDACISLASFDHSFVCGILRNGPFSQ